MTTYGLTSAAGNFGSPLQLLIILAVVVLLFGGKRLRNLGGDLGNAIKGFKNAVASPEPEKTQGDDKHVHQLNSEQVQLTTTSETEKTSANRAG